jgi:hypothetical protein
VPFERTKPDKWGVANVDARALAGDRCRRAGHGTISDAHVD